MGHYKGRDIVRRRAKRRLKHEANMLKKLAAATPAPEAK